MIPPANELSRERFESDLAEVMDDLDLWYNELSTRPPRHCKATRNLIENRIDGLKRLYPRRAMQITLRVQTKLDTLFSEEEHDR